MSTDFNKGPFGTAFKTILSNRAYKLSNAIRRELMQRLPLPIDVHTTVNVLLETGSFDKMKVAESIRDTFNMPAEPVDNPFQPKLTKEALQAVRAMQKQFFGLFRYPPDVNMLVNAMIVTARLEKSAMVNHIRKAFIETPFLMLEEKQPVVANPPAPAESVAPPAMAAPAEISSPVASVTPAPTASESTSAAESQEEEIASSTKSKPTQTQTSTSTPPVKAAQPTQSTQSPKPTPVVAQQAQQAKSAQPTQLTA
jgi:hypothetical protein